MIMVIVVMRVIRSETTINALRFEGLISQFLEVSQKQEVYFIKISLDYCCQYGFYLEQHRKHFTHVLESMLGLRAIKLWANKRVFVLKQGF